MIKYEDIVKRISFIEKRKIKNIYHQISGERSERTDSVLSKRQDIRGRKKYLERDGNTD